MSTYPYLWDSHLADILVKAGFSGDGYLRAFGTIQGESAGDPYCTNRNLTASDKPAQGWFEGGKPWDAGLCQWNAYWQLSDPDNNLFSDPASEFYLPDRATALKKAYDPIWSVNALFAYTEGGTKNWSTWLAYRDGFWNSPEFMDRAKAALAKVSSGSVLTYKPLTISGGRAISAKSIPTRCNPPMSESRFYRLNAYVWIAKYDPATNTTKKVRVKVTPELLLPPGTDVRVGYTTTRLAAGPIVAADGTPIIT